MMNLEHLKETQDNFRNDLIEKIHTTIKETKGYCIGTFYKNIGEHYLSSEVEDEYQTTPIVVVNTESCGYESATVFDLYIDPNDNEIKVTLNIENCGDFDEPIKSVQTEGLLNIYSWLIEHSFLKEANEDPYRCAECGSLNIEEKAWVDVNTKRYAYPHPDIEIKDLWCQDCDKHTSQKCESEMLEIINKWWEDHEGYEKHEMLGDVTYQDNEETYAEASDRIWYDSDIETKIKFWNEYKEK